MADNEFSVSDQARRVIEGEGYSIPSSMAGRIAEWRGWYAGNGDFFKVPYVTTKGKRKTRRRASLNPARRVCREMASLILTEDTEVSVDAPNANRWLQGYLDAANFWPSGQTVVEQAFALGTAAWALSYRVREDATSVELRAYDARMVIPLSWDAAGVSECAFVTRVRLGGKAAEQLQMMTMDDDTGTYHIRTWYFQDGREASDADTIADFDTESPRKPFGIFRPGILNVYDDLSPYGASIFADAIGAVRAVDAAWDALVQEVTLTQARILADESMLDVVDEGGRPVPTGAIDDILFRKMEGKQAKDFIEIFSPDIRVAPLREALDAALAELGACCGFGQKYFTLDRAGGLKTATEVVADNSCLMRNVRKHENVIRGAIQDVAGALIDAARIHCGEAGIEEDFGAVSVAFDDSVISDTRSEKETMLAEIAAGVVPPWMYLEKFYGKTEEEARALLPQGALADPGY